VADASGPSRGDAQRRRAGRGAALALAAVLLAGCDLIDPSRSDGERLYRRLCADCHGSDGSGNTPRYMGNYKADLLDDHWQNGSDSGAWEIVIRDGVFGEMPANPDLSNAEVQELVRYLRQLREDSSGTRG
jgi:mono/diheme cytochrome c family protein